MLFKVSGYRLKLLQSEDTAILQTFLEKCSDYSRLVSGSNPAPSAAGSLLADHPEGKRPEDKFVIGIFTAEQELAGVGERDHSCRGDPRHPSVEPVCA